MNKPSLPRAKRSLGQNFLCDPNVVARIVDAVEPNSVDIVFEIGPGRGALTEKLVRSGAEIVAIEIDRDLIEPLIETFGSSKNLHLIELDVLTVNFADVLQKLNFSPDHRVPIKLVANLPYYISTAVLQRLAEQREIFTKIVLMLQREVVDRITAAPHHSERGFLTVLTEAAFDIERLLDVPPDAFRPIPKVWSSVIRLTPKVKSPSEEGLRQLISAAFAQKRKTIANNLKASVPNYAGALERAGIDPKCRAEELSLDDWLTLNNIIRLP